MTEERAADDQVDLVIQSSEDLEERIRLFEGRTCTSGPEVLHGRGAVERQNGQAVGKLGQLNEGTCKIKFSRLKITSIYNAGQDIVRDSSRLIHSMF